MGIMSFLATKYGTVIDGKYKGCKFALGVDNNNITTNLNQFLFIKGFNEIARIYFWNLVEHEQLSEDNSGIELKFTWEDNTSSIIYMYRGEKGQERIDKIRKILKWVDDNKKGS